MTLHVLGFPHTQTTGRFVTCAYTSKAVRFCRMMAAAGQKVILYSGDENEVEVGDGGLVEHVPLFTEAERVEWYGTTISDGDFAPVVWDTGLLPWRIFNARATNEILQRLEPRDVLCTLAGECARPVAETVPELQCLEYGVGYKGVFSPFRVYESHAWMHWLYGKDGIEDGRWYDAVIPNFFDPADFDPELEAPDGMPPEYLLFVGRCIYRKGLAVAGQVAERAGLPLVVAGYGARWEGDERDVLVDQEGNHVGKGDEFVYVGPVEAKQRARLMAGAVALLAPTLYIEPFGGVAVEAMLSGTPAITSDFGAFTETVETGRTGFRFRTLAEGAQAVGAATTIDPLGARERAVERFAMENVAPAYLRVLERLEGLYGAGFNA